VTGVQTCALPIFEQLEVQFEVLMKSAERAKERMDELKKLALDVPVTFVDMAEASRMLEVFTEGAFAATDAMRMMADASAASGRNIQEVSFWYGRAYSMVKAGRPFGEAAMRLQEMGLLTGRARNQMERLGKGGRNTAKVMKILNREFTKFSGASARAALTWGGQISMWQDAWDQALDAVGKELLPFAKTKLTAVTEAVKKLIKDGTLAQWGKNIVAVFERVEKFIRANVGPAFGFLQSKFNELKSAFTSSGISGVAQVISSDLTDVITSAFSTLLTKVLPVAIDFGIQLGIGIAKGVRQSLAKSLDESFLGRQLNKLENILSFKDPNEPKSTKSTKGGMNGFAKVGLPSTFKMIKSQNMKNFEEMSQNGQLNNLISGGLKTTSGVRIESVSEEAARAIKQQAQSSGGF